MEKEIVTHLLQVLRLLHTTYNYLKDFIDALICNTLYNAAYMENGYRQGYTEGVADGLSKVNVVYTYHAHEGNSSAVGGCYGNKSEIRYNYTYCSCPDADDLYWPSWAGRPICGLCDHPSDTHSGTGSKCGAVTSQTPYTYNYIGLTCGKTEETIESATIIY